MGIFRRSGRPEDQSERRATDPTTDPLGEPAAPLAVGPLSAHADALVAQALTEHGFELRPAPAGEVRYVAADGTVATAYTATFAARHSTVPPQEWPNAARSFVASLLPRADAPDQGLDGVRDVLLPRIFALAAVPPEAREHFLRAGLRLTEELVVLPSLDLPDRVETVTNLASLGTWEAIWPVGTANLLALDPPGREDLDAGQVPDRTVHLLTGQDFYVASRVLVLDQLMARLLGPGFAAPHGMLVATPSRHVLAVHVVTGPGAVLAIQQLQHLADWDEPSHGPTLSNRVHYRSPDGALQPVTSRAPDGSVAINAVGPFEEALRAVGALA